MQTPNLADLTNQELAAAHTEAIDLGNAATTVAYFPLRDLAAIIRDELTLRGVRECGVCKVATPGAVDWGCTCSMTPEESARDAANFARIHD